MGIRQSCMRMNHCLVKARVSDLPVAINHHLADHGEPVYLGFERTQPVGQHFGEHRDNALWKIHRVTARKSLFVQCAPDGNVMTHISNGNPNAKPRSFSLAVNRIIKISRVLAIDRNQPKTAQVNAICFVGLCRLIAKRTRLC